MKKSITIDYADFKGGFPCKFKRTCAKISLPGLENLLHQYEGLIARLRDSAHGSPADVAITIANVMQPMQWLKAYIEKRKKRLGQEVSNG